MADDIQDVVEVVDADKRETLKKLVEQDSKTGRHPEGFWRLVIAGLGGAMVLFYFYTAGLASVATQYHRGVYVFITYVLVFLLYPAGKSTIRVPLNLFLGFLVSSVAGALLFYDSIDAFHDRLTAVGQTWTDQGFAAAVGSALALWPLALATLALAAALYVADSRLMERFRGNPTASDILLALTSAAVVYYWIHEFENLNYRAGAETNLDAMISIVGLVVSIEVCRRVLGWSMTLIGVGMLAYCYFGPYFPEIVAHRGFGIERTATALYLTTNGVFGVMANVLATYVILFIFFGAFLQKSGAGKFFIDLPMALAGKSTGGPAKVAVMASALFGSVSGSAIANTVSTGAFTIPLMKRAGFKPHVAGAIEPAASIGGMFMPPIMGAGGFLMAELTETPYAYIMMIAVAPALLYFFSVFCMIHFEAKKHKIEGFRDPDAPTAWQVLRTQWFYALPLAIITVLMIIGKSPGYSAFWATLSCIAVGWIRENERFRPVEALIFVPPAVLLGLIASKSVGDELATYVTAGATIWCLGVSLLRKNTAMGLREIWDAIQIGARNTLIIGATLGVIGIIVGTISLTGIGLKFSDIIISLAGGNLLLAVLLVGVASLVLGMGVPVTAAYLITAVLAVPPLTEMGVVLIAAHMIVYWFSQDSNITPPVCVAAYAGAAIAGSDPWKTGWTSFKFAKLLYVMPLLFAFTPSILFEGKPLVAPEVHDEVMGAMITELDVKVGDSVDKGQVIGKLLDGEEIRDLKASRDGVVAELTVNQGQFIDGGIVVAEMHARPVRVISSIWSAVLGTVAFSALTMFYLIRKTNPLEWVLLAAGTLLLYWPTLLTDGIGLVLVGLVYMSQKARNKRDEQQALAGTA